MYVMFPTISKFNSLAQVGSSKESIVGIWNRSRRKVQVGV